MDNTLIYLDNYKIVALSVTDFLILSILIPLTYIFFKSVFKINKADNKFFAIAFLLKLFFTIFHFYVLVNVYKLGDSFNYFSQAQILRESTNSFSDFYKISTGYISDFDDVLQEKLSYDVPSTFATTKLCYILSYIFFNSYLVISIFVSLLCFASFWYLYKKLSKLFNVQSGLVFCSILCVPSFLFWSGIYGKEQVCLAMLGFAFGKLIGIFYLKQSKLGIIWAAILLGLIYIIKNYIVISLFISLFISFIIHYFFQIKVKTNFFVKLFYWLCGIIMLALIPYFLRNFEELIQEKIVEQIKSINESAGLIKEYIELDGKVGSAYDIGLSDFSILGILKKAPSATSTALFRPFIWEANNVLQLLSALESLVAISVLIYAIFKLGILSFFKHLFNTIISKTIVFFVLFFSFLTGLTSFNFGTLARYKTPCIPFYYFLISILLIKTLENSKLVKLKK